MVRLLNFGMGIPAWINLLVILVAVALAVWIGYAIYALILDPNNWKLRVKPIVFRVLILAVFLWATLTAFGPGTPAPPMPSDIGAMKLIEKAPDEKSLSEIQKEAAEKRDEFLKAQDRGFQKEKEEADKYIDEALKKYAD